MTRSSPVSVLLLLLLLLITGCANLPSREGPPAPVVEAGSGLPVPPPVRSPQTVGPPVPDDAPLQRSPLPESSGPDAPATTPTAALLREVDGALAAGDLDRAAALCERALRIAPREGLLWYRLAEIRYRQRRYDEALGFAQRAQSLAAGNTGLLDDSIRLQELSRAAGR